MYIEFSKLAKYPLSADDYFFLCATKNKAKEYLQQFESEHYKRFEELSLIKYIKGKGEYFERVRIDKKGETILKDISTSGDIPEYINVLVNWLKNTYLGRSNGIIKNKTEMGRRINWYAEQTGITHNKLAVLLSCFINDSFTPDSGMSFDEFKKENPRAVFSNLADNIAWNPPNNFARHYKLEESPLERYREQNEQYIEEQWKLKGLEDE